MISEDEIKLVLERLATMPQTLKLSLGDKGSFSREELIKEVKKGSETGELVVKVYMNYLRSFRHEVLE